MKKLRKISLRDLGQTEMQKRTMNMLRGGQRYCLCSDEKCPCEYAGDKEGPDDDKYGGSSTSDNLKANGGDCGWDVANI